MTGRRLVLAVGLVRWSRRAAVGGTVVLLGGATFAGATGLDPTRLLIAVGCLVFAYYLTEHAIQLYRQVGARAPTLRVELLHAVGAGAVLASTAVIGASLFRGLSGGSTLTAVALLAGTILLTGFLRA